MFFHTAPVGAFEETTFTIRSKDGRDLPVVIYLKPSMFGGAQSTLERLKQNTITIINELERNGEIVRPILGVSMLDLSQISASQQSSVLKLPEDVTEGVVIAEVQALSAAELGGLKQYDVITEMNGESITSIVDLRKILYALEVGTDVEISYYREGTLQSTTVTLTEGQTSAE